MLTAILAISDDNVIGTTGADGRPCLPWSLPPDLKRFKQLTSGHAIIMGRTTFESIGKPLPNRRNIVVSRKQEAWHGSLGLEWAVSPEDALAMALQTDPSPLIIGGAQLYAALWPRVERIELTRVEMVVGLGLVFAWDETRFRLVSQSERLEHASIHYRFETYEVRT